MRADGSSKFAANNRWGYFPSFAASWRISGYDGLRDKFPWLTNLKLRYSYGTAGNNNIPAGLILQEYAAYATTCMPSIRTHANSGLFSMPQSPTARAMSRMTTVTNRLNSNAI